MPTFIDYPGDTGFLNIKVTKPKSVSCAGSNHSVAIVSNNGKKNSIISKNETS